jgi:hypothetical protein
MIVIDISHYYKGGAEWASTIRKHRRYKQKLFAK